MKTNHSHARTRQRNQQRGTVILLALAVLAVLSLVGVTYITIVRVDRDSAVATTKQQDFDRQVAVVIGRMRDILTADLFGNKNVPRTLKPGPLNDSFYPKFMEDGEYSDYPSTHIFRSGINANSFGTARDARLDPQRGTTDTRAATVIAPVDDAWLASTEPIWDRNSINNTDRWRQITNLRATYEWSDAGQEWRRMDGRFVDLAQWFLNPIDGRANTSLNLLAFGGDINGTGGGRAPIGPLAALAINPVTSQITNNTAVYNRQIAELDQIFGGNDRTLTGADERLWTDTDGDLRADARWTQLEELGNLYDRQWLVAARIIDASALVNFNTAIEFPHRGFLAQGPDADVPSGSVSPPRKAADLMGTGVTPADVDLYRLLTYNHGASNPSVYILPGTGTPGSTGSLELNNIATGSSFANHLEEGLDIDRILLTLNDLDINPTEPAVTNPIHEYFNEGAGYRWQALGGSQNPLSRAQRQALYRYATGSATNRRIQTGQLYSARELLDLRAFWGTNNRAVTSKFEQYIDGPESAGLLPSAAGAPVALGPLRAGEDPLQVRSFDSQTPNLEQLFFDRRKHLTPVNGVAAFSPVPALNNTPGNITTGAPAAKINFNQLAAFATEYSEATRRLDDGNAPPERLTDARTLLNQSAQDIFSAFSWAIMPYATDKVLSRELTANVADYNAHYGGGTNGTVQRLFTAPAVDSTIEAIRPDDVRASYALWKALSLTVNLIDAVDTNFAATPSATEIPTAIRFFPGNGPNQPLIPQAGDSSLSLDPALRHGNLNITSLDARLVGGSGPDLGGITVIGLDRQPFLTEVATFAVYEAEGSMLFRGQNFIPGGTSATLDADDPTIEVGSIIAVELGNPWPDEINVSDYYIHIQSETDRDNDNSIQLHLADGTPTIPAGGSRVFFYATRSFGDDQWDAIVDLWEQTVTDELAVTNAAPPFRLNNARPIGTITDEDARTSDTSEILRLKDPADFNDGTRRIIFKDLADHAYTAAGNASTIAVQLRRQVRINRTAPFNQLQDILVDRLAQGSDADRPDKFFGALSPDNTANNTNELSSVEANNIFGGRLGLPDDNQPRFVPFIFRAAVHGSIRRPKALKVPNQGTFPYVFERPADNLLEVYPSNADLIDPDVNAEPYSQVAVLRPTTLLPRQTQGSIIVDDQNPPFPPEFVTETNGNLARKLNIFDSAETLLTYPNIQLFVPDRPFDTVADLHLISSIAHLHIHHRNDNPRTDPGPRLSSQNNRFSTARMPFNRTVDGQTAAWFTFSEQLGWDANFYADTANSKPNPYALTLDPTRYVPAGDLSNPQTAGNSAPLSPINAVPLALRVFDCFEAIDLPGFLAQGRVNINTAPLEVLQTLPLIDPFNDLPTTNPVLSANTPFSRGDLIAAYRDQTTLGSGLNFTVNRGRTLNASNLRTDELPRIAVPGELAIMGVWDTTDRFNPAPNTNQGTFLEVAAAPSFGAGTNSADSPPFELWSDGFSPNGDPYNPTDNLAYANTDLNPKGDAEERLALYRAVSNIVSTRSDVFMATFVLRAYDPDVVESIETDGSLNGALDAMADDRFRPDYETRWLVVFDRSNVRSPLDRPRVLLQVQLPPATP